MGGRRLRRRPRSVPRRAPLSPASPRLHLSPALLRTGADASHALAVPRDDGDARPGPKRAQKQRRGARAARVLGERLDRTLAGPARGGVPEGGSEGAVVRRPRGSRAEMRGGTRRRDPSPPCARAMRAIRVASGRRLFLPNAPTRAPSAVPAPPRPSPSRLGRSPFAESELRLVAGALLGGPARRGRARGPVARFEAIRVSRREQPAALVQVVERLGVRDRRLQPRRAQRQQRVKVAGAKVERSRRHRARAPPRGRQRGRRDARCGRAICAALASSAAPKP